MPRGWDPAVMQILNKVGSLGRPDLARDKRPKTDRQKQNDIEARLGRVERRNKELAVDLDGPASERTDN